MSMHRAGLLEIVRGDPRFALEAYEFVFEALDYTHQTLGRPSADPVSGDEPGPEHHLTGQELVFGIRDLALREFGRMARVVFRMWGVNRTGDLGEIVFNLIDAGMLNKTDSDQRSDFHDLFDLDEAMLHQYEISLDNVE